MIYLTSDSSSRRELKIIRQQAADKYVSELQDKVQIFFKEYENHGNAHRYMNDLKEKAEQIQKNILELQRAFPYNTTYNVCNKKLIKDKLEKYQSDMQLAIQTLNHRISHMPLI